jgi:hypothetical protein
MFLPGTLLNGGGELARQPRTDLDRAGVIVFIAHHGRSTPVSWDRMCLGPHSGATHPMDAIRSALPGNAPAGRLQRTNRRSDMGNSVASATGITTKQQAAGTSIMGAGLSAYGDILSGQGTAAGENYKAAALENAAQRGRVAAVQAGASATERLNFDLANIDAARAAAHSDPTSPTGAAIRDWNEQLGLTKKAIDVDNLMAQSQQEASDAAYLRSASKYALLGGELSAGADILKAAGPALLTL